MRVLLTTDPVGGVWQYTVTLARALASDGHAVLLAVIGDPSDPQLAQLPEEIVFTCRDFRLEWMTDAVPDIQRAANWLAALARSWCADVVHLNQMVYPGAARFDAPTLVAVHSDVFSWFSEVRGVSPPPVWDWYRTAVTAGLVAASQVVTPSRYQAGLVRRHYGVAAPRVIHNGVEVIAARNHRKSPLPAVITAGRAWDEAKGIRMLDEAVTQMRGIALPPHLLGDLQGPDGALFRPEHLRCEGMVSTADSHRWMSAATIYCAPSLYEPFGLAPAEAAATGCALALSDIGSFRELWDGCAAFFAPGDPVGLARVVTALAVDPTWVADLGAAALARVRERYSAEKFANYYLAMYYELHRGETRSIRLSTPVPRGA